MLIEDVKKWFRKGFRKNYYLFQENGMKILHVVVFTPTSTNVWQAVGRN